MGLYSIMKMERPNWICVIVLAWVLLLEGFCCTHGCLDKERDALLQLKPFFYHLKWPMSGEESLNCCQWERVKCDDLTGRVIELSLIEHWQWKFPVWYLNASYFLPFEQLRRLDLLGNNIAGCVDNGGFEVLSSRLRNLEVLDLSYNNFSSSIISSVSEISSLKAFHLHGNSMTSSAHANGFEGLSKLSNLEVLSLGYNSLDNSVLSSLRNLSSLKVLNLAGNLLNGTIYTHELNHLINLRKLDMNDNKIEAFGSLKGGGSVLRLSNLEELILGYNLFTNDALHYLSKLSNLKSLYLAGNRIRGSLKIRDLEGLTMLEELDLSDNGIGTFVGPQERKTMDRLRVLRLANLKSNTCLVLQSFGAFSSLKTLDLSNNIFNRTNSLLTNLGNLSTVEELFFDGSSLPENFLQTIGSFSALKVLYSRRCGHKGTLPSQGLCELRNLQELDLAQNELGGTIPQCLTNLSSLRYLDLSSNQFTGNISSTPIPNLMSIEFLSLGYNKFRVPISLKPFANHSNLKQFLCQNNELIPEPGFESWTPKFQLQVLNLAIFTANKVYADIPNFLYYQHDLISIDLSGANFSGVFPSWLFENNTMLNTLSMKDSSFGGLFRWPSRPNPNIIRIDISHNQLQGEIPTNISSVFPNLKDLIVSENSFGGNIPATLGESESIQTLDLSKNNFSGGIPEQFLKHHSIIFFLKLSHNQLSGKIHPTSFNSSRLEYLQLDNNEFEGKIPDLSFMYSLLILDLSNNFFSEFPRLTSSLPSLQIIYLSTNHFLGPLPSQLCKISNLRALDVSENKFSGLVPSCFSQFTKIESLHLYKNELVGPLPSFFTNYTSMVALDLRHNNFSGSVPSWIGRLSNLSVVLLQGNRIGGEIPVELCQLNHLSILDLSSNNLSGRLPPCLGNMTFKTEKELSYAFPDYTSMDELLPFQVKYSDNAEAKEVIEFTTKDSLLHYTGNILQYMSGIDLSCNQFYGEIPSEFGKLSNVRALNLSHNNLVGLIPTTFSNLKQMESLDLSYNKFNGTIPPQLTELNSLAVFKVAHNNVSGPIPDRKAQFATFDESSYEGNPYLCGPPLSKGCNKAAANTTPSPSEYDGEEEDDEFMAMSDFYVSFAVSYIMVLLTIAAVLYINPYWWHLWSYKVDMFIRRWY